MVTAAILRRIDFGEVARWLAATAQNTAEGAVVIAAGGAAGDPSEAAGAVRNFHWGAAQ